MLKLGDNILSFDELDLTIEEDTTIGKDILFSFRYEDSYCKYKMTINNQK